MRVHYLFSCLPPRACQRRLRAALSKPPHSRGEAMRRLVLATVLAAAAVPAFAQPFRIAMREDPDSLDPALARTYVSRIVFAGLCDKLFDINEKLEIVPQLALSYEWTDPTNLVVKLRPGVAFHDGEKLDAAAVKYSLDRHLT